MDPVAHKASAILLAMKDYDGWCHTLNNRRLYGGLYSYTRLERHRYLVLYSIRSKRQRFHSTLGPHPVILETLILDKIRWYMTMLPT